MSEIQKALEAESRQQGSGSGETDPLTVPDHSFCGILTDYDDDESLFGEMLQPGLFHSISGDRKSGKTHLCVNLMYLLAIGFQGFLIMICVGIYAVLIQTVAFSTEKA